MAPPISPTLPKDFSVPFSTIQAAGRFLFSGSLSRSYFPVGVDSTPKGRDVPGTALAFPLEKNGEVFLYYA